MALSRKTDEVVSMCDIADAIRTAAIELRGPHGRLQYVTDGSRHLICLPYSVENLHVMAAELNINRCWFHSRSKYPHYDIPKRRIAEIEAKCRMVTPQELLKHIKAALL
jgi:hypothetical protein